MLTPDEIRHFYDAFGSRQDRQFYEDAPLRVLVEQGRFDEARHIVEFGCGTGKLADLILEQCAPSSCKYHGQDSSRTMTSLCREKLAPFSDRVTCSRTAGEPVVDVEDQSADRFVSTYVLDLLSSDDAARVLNEAHRILVPGGYLCLASLTHGVNLISRLVEKAWNAFYRLKPAIVGGCRPIDLAKHLHDGRWRIVHDSVIVSYGVPSEVMVAMKLASLDNGSDTAERH